MVLTIYDIVKAHGGTITVNSFNGPPGGSISVISNYNEPETITVKTFNSPKGGELKVETAPAATAKEEDGTEFIIRLPIYQT